MKRKTIGTLMLVSLLVMILGMTTACGNKDKKKEKDENTVSLSYWQMMGEDPYYYETYADNPVWKYISENYTFNDKKLEIEFSAPPKGSEFDNLNTLLSTGEYSKVIDMSITDAKELYNEGIVQDITEYVEEHMPNYMKHVEENLTLKRSIYEPVDGQMRILKVFGVADGIDPNFQGYCYRRDWIAKYGKHPETGEDFNYGFENPEDKESWFDDVVFPSGEVEPVYISDWEWMLEIFSNTINELGIDGGYAFSPFYMGYMETGDLLTGFGGGGPLFYENKEGNAAFGGTSDNFRFYIEALRNWYDNGWINKQFAELSNDMFFSVDREKVYQGKVGLWQGQQSTVGTQLDTGLTEYTDGIVVYGARQPINDKYGGSDQQFKEPDMMFQSGQLGVPFSITDKASEEEIITFLKFVDFMYTEEGKELTLGLTKEQVDESQNEFYINHGLENGLYEKVEEDGVTVYKKALGIDDGLEMAAALGRIAGLPGIVENVDNGYDRYVAHAVEQWDYYENTGAEIYGSAVNNIISDDDKAELSKIRSNLGYFLTKAVPSMIMNSGSYDVTDDASWDLFVSDLNKYKTNKAVEIYQGAYDSLVD